MKDGVSVTIRTLVTDHGVPLYGSLSFVPVQVFVESLRESGLVEEDSIVVTDGYVEYTPKITQVEEKG